MALGNGNPKNGDKGSNWSYEFKSLTQLKNIRDAVDALAAIAASSQDYEAKLVIDQGGAGETWLEVRIWNPDTQTWETPEYSRPGDNTFYQLGDPGGPIAPLVYINPNTYLAQIVNNTTWVANVGSADGTILGGTVLKSGEIINFDSGSLNNTFNSFAYDATGTEFIITFIS